MPGEMVTISAADGGKFQGFLASPDSGEGPGIVVLQEIFGVNYVMRELCHHFAAQGYFALCPDLFWRQGPNIELSDKSEGEWGRAFGLYQGFDVDLGIKDADAALAHLRGVKGCTGKAGAVGYCLGGKLAYLMATRTDVNCSVGYYGVGIEESLDEQGGIKNPHMTHIAELDQFVPPEAQAKVKGGLAGNALVTAHSYPNVDHAFARLGGAHYDAAAAELANNRTAEFFTQNLG